jgi:Mg/Co/Ni transporter MgtE (contains CBS domain)
MFAHNLVQNNYPNITLTDKVSFALQLMDDYDIQHLCVIDERKFVAIISKNDLLDADENETITALQSNFIQASVKINEYFLEILRIFSETDLTLIPVVDNDKIFIGVITQLQLLKSIANLLGVKEKGAVIVLEIDKKNFSLGEISRLVETNDAYITQLNTLSENEMLLITLKVNKTEVSDIVATFQRYDYSVKYFFGEEHYNNELQENYEHLISYLNI